jgi:putative intracellular protease/amidase
MSIGLGLFLSTLALVAAVLIGRRHAWKKAGKVAAWTMVVATLASGGLIADIRMAEYYQAREKEVKSVKKVEALRAGSIDSLERFTLGASQNEVVYRMGEPKAR